MTAKHLSAASCFFMGIATLSAQAPTAAFRTAGANDTNLGNLVGQLAQNALVVLLGIVLLMGTAWLFCIWNACAELNKKQKNAHTPSLSILPIGFFLLFSMVASAQKTNVWRGGAPGHETDWSFFKNWSAGSAPSEFDYVVIPDVSASTGDYPVIRKGEVEVLGLEIQSGASLTLLPKARLLAERIQIVGTCKGCEWRVLVEGTEAAATVLRQ